MTAPWNPGICHAWSYAAAARETSPCGLLVPPRGPRSPGNGFRPFRTPIARWLSRWRRCRRGGQDRGEGRGERRQRVTRRRLGPVVCQNSIPIGSVRSQTTHSAGQRVPHDRLVDTAVISAIRERQRVRKSCRLSTRGTGPPGRWRTRKYGRSSSNAVQNRAADAKRPKPSLGSSRCLMTRWLCAARLCKYWLHRCRTFSPQGPADRSAVRRLRVRRDALRLALGHVHAACAGPRPPGAAGSAGRRADRGARCAWSRGGRHRGRGRGRERTSGPRPARRSHRWTRRRRRCPDASRGAAQ